MNGKCFLPAVYQTVEGAAVVVTPVEAVAVEKRRVYHLRFWGQQQKL